MNLNADALSRIRVNHINNITKQEQQISNDENNQEPEINYEEISNELNTFASLLKTTSSIDYCKHSFDPSKIYVENNIEFPVVDLLCFIFSEQPISFKNCQNLTETSDKDRILIIIDQFHSAKAHIDCGLNETVRRIKDR